MTEIQRVTHNKILYAIIIPHNYEKEGISFCTPDNLSQQLAYIKHPKGHKIPAHVHNSVSRNVEYTLETLLIKKGRVRVDFYTKEKEYFQSIELSAGDVVLLVEGGHGFTVLEEADLIEIKQGPYTGDKDKTRFKSIDESKIQVKAVK